MTTRKRINFPSIDYQCFRAVSITVFHIETDVYLMQYDPQIVRLRIRNHDEFQGRRRLIIM